MGAQRENPMFFKPHRPKISWVRYLCLGVVVMSQSLLQWWLNRPRKKAVVLWFDGLVDQMLGAEGSATRQVPSGEMRMKIRTIRVPQCLSAFGEILRGMGTRSEVILYVHRLLVFHDQLNIRSSRSQAMEQLDQFEMVMNALKASRPTARIYIPDDVQGEEREQITQIASKILGEDRIFRKGEIVFHMSSAPGNVPRWSVLKSAAKFACF